MCFKERNDAMKSGIYENLSNREYHASEGLSHSALVKFRKSPAHYKAYVSKLDEVSPATQHTFDIGTLFHSMMLEPDKFNDMYHVVSGDRRKKETRLEIASASLDKIIITPKEYDMLRSMEHSMKRNSDVMYLINHSKHEQSVYTEIDDVLCKCRPDGILWDEGVIFDLKSCEDASNTEFPKDIAKYSYHVEHAFYSMVASNASKKPIRDFIFIACEKKPPYNVALYEVSQADIDDTFREIHDDLKRFKKCMERDEWPGYDDDINTVVLPSWVKRKRSV